MCLFLDYFNKFLCIISVPNLNGGNVPKFHVRNVPNFEVGNVPNLKLGNCIQSIITRPDKPIESSNSGGKVPDRFELHFGFNVLS